MEKIKKPLKDVQFNSLTSDYKAEIVAAALLKQKVPTEGIFIKRLGNNDRSFNKDVKAIVNEYYELEDHSVIIETFREGIYDYLPEGFFHTPHLGQIKDGVDSIVAEIRKQKEIEKNARTFFQPFELEAYYTTLAALVQEDNLDLISSNYGLLNILGEIWPLLNELEPEMAKIFVYLLPYLQEVRGKKDWFEKCLGSFLQMPVHITFEQNIVDGYTSDSSLSIGTMQLGISSILSGKHADGERNWVVNIGPIPPEELPKFIPGSDFRKLLQSFYNYCMPATVKVNQHFITQKETYNFVLTKEIDSNLHLGYSTFL